MTTQAGQGASVALGLFDGVHIGHAAVVRHAVEYAGNTLLPSVFTFTLRRQIPDSKQDFGKIMTQEHKWERLRNLGIRSIVSPSFEEVSSLSGEEFFHKILLGQLHAKVLCCGDDYRFGHCAACTVTELSSFCKDAGIILYRIPSVCLDGEPVSSTRIRRAVRQGDMELASRLLGEPFTYDFAVVHGRQLGRKLQFPTINQHFPDSFLLPPFGVYASVARIGATLYPGVTNVGVKPTVGSDSVLGETYLLGYEGDLYGQHIPVSLLSFLRPEERFQSLEELTVQMRRDRLAAEEIVLDWMKRQGLPALAGEGSK